jgi:hypothetical protein
VKWLHVGSGLALIGLLAAASVWFVLLRHHGDSGRDAESNAQQYFQLATAGNYDATYSMLDSVTRRNISREEWQRENQASLAEIGALKRTAILGAQPGDAGEEYVAVRLEFEGRDPLEVVVRMVHEGSEWHPSLSVARPPTEQWQHVEP